MGIEQKKNIPLSSISCFIGKAKAGRSLDGRDGRGTCQMVRPDRPSGKQREQTLIFLITPSFAQKITSTGNE